MISFEILYGGSVLHIAVFGEEKSSEVLGD